MKNKMKQLLIPILFIFLICASFYGVYASSEPSTISEAVFLMDNLTGKVLYEKNKDKKLYPASTTKIMTAILTLEHANLNDVVTISYDTTVSLPDGYVTANLQVNEKLTVEQLLQLLLVHSANDAANALAEHVGGSIESFVSMMNTKVQDLGLKNTNFTNTYGLHDDNHYTTAYDLAHIMQYCVRNENFRIFAGKASCAIPATNQYGPRAYASTNESILPNHRNYYSYLTCGKTGFTTQAGDCLVSCAYKDGLEYICVILGGRNVNGNSSRFTETKTVYDYGFSNFSYQNIVSQNDVLTELEIKNATKDTKQLRLQSDKTVRVLLKNDTAKESIVPQITTNDVSAPIVAGTKIGSATYTVDNESYTVDLIAANDVQQDYTLYLIIGLVGFVLIAFLFFHLQKKRKNRRKSNLRYRIR